MAEDKKQLVADTGRVLLEKGLVARTWGNISARIDNHSFAISPSGLGYENMQGKDVPVYDFEKDSWEGSRKPSSEKKIHAAAYSLYPEVNFVIHTHQDYATAVGLGKVEKLNMTDDEKELLGSIEIAGYGLPGTGKLKKNVTKALKSGSKIILMVHHGALILGENKDDAIKKAEALEMLCKRIVEETIQADERKIDKTTDVAELNPLLKKACKGLEVVTDDNILYAAAIGGIDAELDDIAQMIGRHLRSVKNVDADILNALNKQDAVLVKGVGCLIFTEDPDDAQALKLLVKKAAIAKRYTSALKISNELSSFDCALMNFVFKKKYAKKKAG